jgi:ArsR family transcriptional regulator
MSVSTISPDSLARRRTRIRVADFGPRGVSPATASAVAAMFRVLGDATRVRLIAALAAGELTVGALAQAVGMTESAVSHQLRVLKDARMVKGRPEGRQVFYALDDLHVLTLFRQALTHAREPAGRREDVR